MSSCLESPPLGELVVHTRAMATDITLRTPVHPRVDPAGPAATLSGATSVFTTVDVECTRFDPASPLMTCNAAPDCWHRVPLFCYRAISEAWLAYRLTGGGFDPRVLDDLVRLGYDRTLPFGSGVQLTRRPAAAAPGRRRFWQPSFRPATSELHLGGERIDLGGIGKGLSVRWAAERLRQRLPDFLIDAGGDVYCGGLSAENAPWRIGVEDPVDGVGLVAVLGLSDLACTTSSIRLRKWELDGRPVHHIIDPRTGEPGGDGLLSVTVVGADPATAEVWSKVLFLAGAGRIAEHAKVRGIAALWVTTAGELRTSVGVEPHLLWRRS